MFISPHRKTCSVKGLGIQYIPGHLDPFMDHVVANYVTPASRVLDLGGGGFRFAAPASEITNSVTVVDRDVTSLDREAILTHIATGDDGWCSSLLSNVTCHCSEVSDFLEHSPDRYDLITCFRVIHFLTGQQIMTLFRLIQEHLSHDGVFVVSFITPFDHGASVARHNEVYHETEPVDERSEQFRKFKNTSAAHQIMQEQNLAEHITILDERYLDDLCRTTGFERIEGPLQSTRIVDGFILKKIA